MPLFACVTAALALTCGWQMLGAAWAVLIAAVIQRLGSWLTILLALREGAANA